MQKDYKPDLLLCQSFYRVHIG